ncbi:hypothetical protein HDV01_007026 [Terramyces sp. JEL0728]|nr:hypothetical protein HDV01_007026 [Terramyces sp. JEL0728]
MELLLLVLIIPLIPFYIISTLFSAWIFALGIPFIILTAIVTFLRGFFQALFSRNVLPKLQGLQEQFNNMRKSGDWREPPPSSLHSIRSRINASTNPPSAEPTDSSLAEMIQHQIMNRFHQSNIQTPANFVLSLIPKFLLPAEQPTHTSSPIRSPRSPLVNPISPIINGVDRDESLRKLEMPSFLDELLMEAENFSHKETTHDSVTRDYPKARNTDFKYEPSQYRTVYDKQAVEKQYGYHHDAPKDTVSESIYHSVYSESQVKSNYQSTLSKNFLDELADIADIEISPSESASRNESDEMNDGGELTDAAKLLYMFKARNMMLADAAQVDRVDAIFS